MMTEESGTSSAIIGCLSAFQSQLDGMRQQYSALNDSVSQQNNMMGKVLQLCANNSDRMDKLETIGSLKLTTLHLPDSIDGSPIAHFPNTSDVKTIDDEDDEFEVRPRRVIGRANDKMEGIQMSTIEFPPSPPLTGPGSHGLYPGGGSQKSRDEYEYLTAAKVLARSKADNLANTITPEMQQMWDEAKQTPRKVANSAFDSVTREWLVTMSGGMSNEAMEMARRLQTGNYKPDSIFAASGPPSHLHSHIGPPYGSFVASSPPSTARLPPPPHGHPFPQPFAHPIHTHLHHPFPPPYYY